MIIISRVQWGARPPLQPLSYTSWDRRIGVAFHYSQGNPDDTPRDLQRYAQETLGYRDTHYNFFVDRAGNAYEGRGWLAIAAHAEDQNTPWIGVCFIGRDADVTPQALSTMRAFYDEANRLSGRTLRYSGHGQLPGQNTDCPGTNIKNWIAQGMPQTHTKEQIMFCLRNDTSPQVRVMQIDVMRLGGWVGPVNDAGEPIPHPSGNDYHYCDGNYGARTSRALAHVLKEASGVADTYGDWQYAAVQDLLRIKAARDAIAELDERPLGKVTIPAFTAGPFELDVMPR